MAAELADEGLAGRANGAKYANGQDYEAHALRQGPVLSLPAVAGYGTVCG